MNNVLVCLCHNNHRHIAGIIHLIGLNPDHSQLPLRVHIVCTAAGFSLLKNSIFTDNDGWLWELRNSFPNDKILISHENIHLIQQGNRTVHDISSKDSSQAAAEAIHSLINNLCSTKQGRIYSVMSPGNMIPCSLGSDLTIILKYQDKYPKIAYFRSLEAPFYPQKHHCKPIQVLSVRTSLTCLLHEPCGRKLCRQAFP
ncbi:hypothetical protein [Desulfonatronospira thiodismutans]|uniref:hypothetical protein n=1 Tax=Desulfonatronospira thiodismutans TaxID=488939 RepID=UPI00019758E5|nr:hypothetical protein [Desulfonatronospira thiodismutans]